MIELAEFEEPNAVRAADASAVSNRHGSARCKHTERIAKSHRGSSIRYDAANRESNPSAAGGICADRAKVDNIGAA
jgi:hypothetical protein